MTETPATPERSRLAEYLNRDVGADLARIGMVQAMADGDTPAAIKAAITRWHAAMASIFVAMALELRALGATDGEISAWKGRTVEAYFAHVAAAGRDAFAAMPAAGSA